MEFIPYSCQVIEQDDIDSVVNVLKSSHLTQGPSIPAFEKEIENYCSVKHVTALASGTAALHIGMLALGVNENSTVWTTPITFVATANAALYCGAKVDFVDVDPLTGNICLNALKEKLEKSEKPPTLLAPVHFAGATCDMKGIKALADKYKFKILEDAAHAFGAQYSDCTNVGNCKYSDLTILSFHAVKSVTTAEGGACTTNDTEVYQKLLKLRTHGITRDSGQLVNKSLPSWHYEQQILGFHYRITDLQAALGISQIKKLDRFINKRREVAAYYQEQINSSEIKLPPYIEESAWHLYSLQVPAQKRDKIYQYCLDRKIGTNTHYPCVHLQPFYKQFKFDSLPNAEKYAAQALSIPIHPKLDKAQQDYIIKNIIECLKLCA